MMAKVNWWLEHPPPADVAVSRNIGLFVVGRLAARHGIKVRLQPAATGGITALVWLPDPIVVRPEVGAPASFVPAAPEVPAEQRAPAEPRALAEPKAKTRQVTSVGSPRATWRLRALAPSRAGQPPIPGRPVPAAAAAGATSGRGASPAEDHAGGRRLPIYEAVESDWFSTRGTLSGGVTAAGGSWEASADSGCDAARAVLAPAASGVTAAGLPVRAPRANLVPGAIGGARPDASGPVRSADAARTRLTGFQQGTSRGRAAPGPGGQDPAPDPGRRA
jgi:hypothetical protein